ncbi:MAG: DNA-3-methyladenine glycosylase 2 family protein [Burkholderiales bacterium]|jgi:DNA-3-methyladenine glycosylase II|nr:DNA-3-methyladenine glycosylase 2 family protein [Burkholderiales bacterium]
MKPDYWDRATRLLSRRDPVLHGLINAFPEFHLRRRSDAFTALARAIVGQQISVKAADAVWRRFVAAVDPDQTDVVFPVVAPTAVAQLLPDTLRSAGLSQRKTEYMQDLACRFADGSLNPSSWKTLADEALIEALVTVKGIGRWTAEMFLMFHELRADVFPIADLGLQKAIRLHYAGEHALSLEEMQALAESWRPYRSVATWYLWRSLDPLPVEY